MLSRKGFDSSSGGVPSSLFPDGSLQSLPIPDPLSPIPYGRIRGGDVRPARLVKQLSQDRVSSRDGAHLDPDLNRDSLPRKEGWRPLFGQAGAAQGHLRRQGVGIGDLFLFFGLFQRIRMDRGSYRFDNGYPRQHVIWGWLQIGDIVPVADCDTAMACWADYHPHFHHPAVPDNTLYLATDALSLQGFDGATVPGAGIWSRQSPDRTLTAPGVSSPSRWRLPGWFYPDGQKPPLSYHRDSARWQKEGDHTFLQAASRGQEFVLDADCYPEAIAWLKTHLFRQQF